MTIQIPKYSMMPFLDDCKPGLEKFLAFLVVCWFVVFSTACQQTPTDRESSQDASYDHPVYTLGPGDKIRVTVYGHDDLSGIFIVDDTGRISLPLIRGVNVKGMDLPELEQSVTKHLVRNHIVNPKVSIDLIELRRFCIFGEVRNPGCFNYVYGMIASKAIAIAGGYSYRARKNKLSITREDGGLVVGGHDTLIFGGDIIEVSERFF